MRRILVYTFIVGICRISLESLKVLPNFQGLAFSYDLATNVLEQIFVVLITITSIGIYLESSDKGILALFGRIWKNKPLSSIILAIIAYCVFVSTYIVVEKPYTFAVAKDLWGATIATIFYPQSFLEIISPNVFVLIIVVPAFLFLASRKRHDKHLARNLVYLGTTSLAVGVIFLSFTIYQNEARVDPEGLLYFLLSIMFSSAALSFNRASAYAGFLDRTPNLDNRATNSSQFSRLVKKEHSEIIGSQFLVEVDAGAPYETAVIDFCQEFLSHGDSVMVATPKSSVLQRSLASYTDIRFCLFSSTVSRPTPVPEEGGQILIPQDSLTDIVDVLETIWKQTREDGKTALVLDNLSDRVISVGLERTYKYLKEMLTILGDRKTTCFFLIHGGTMDAKGQNLLRSLFTHILVVSQDRLSVLKE